MPTPIYLAFFARIRCYALDFNDWVEGFSSPKVGLFSGLRELRRKSSPLKFKDNDYNDNSKDNIYNNEENSLCYEL